MNPTPSNRVNYKTVRRIVPDSLNETLNLHEKQKAKVFQESLTFKNPFYCAVLHRQAHLIKIQIPLNRK